MFLSPTNNVKTGAKTNNIPIKKVFKNFIRVLLRDYIKFKLILLNLPFQALFKYF
ncbi:hypothetical protein HMPREF1139_1620 [Campylobacter sp. FOBRC14]|nr:hypothetical protein HMPREF1139_1620 [Campylobacter sp. FOBRC14]